MFYDTPGKTFKGIADAIRELEGSSAPIPVTEMPDRIRALQPAAPLSIDISTKNNRTWIEALIPYIYISSGTGGISESLSDMFNQYCSYIYASSPISDVDIDLSNLYIPPSVTSLAQMFVGARLNSIDLDGWDTRYVTYMYGMFSGCWFNKVWIPKTFDCSNIVYGKPFDGCGDSYISRIYNFDVYTDSTEDRTQEWGINTQYLTVHYNSTHQDFLNA